MKPRLLFPLFLTVPLLAIGAGAGACSGGNDSNAASEGEALRPLVGEFGDLLGLLPNARFNDEAWRARAIPFLPRFETLREEMEQLDLSGLYDEARDEAVLGVVAYVSALEAWIKAIDESDLDLFRTGTDVFLEETTAHFREFNDLMTRAEQGDGASRDSNGSSSDSTNARSSAPLESSDISPFRAGVRDAGLREVQAVVASGQEVISCSYGPTDRERNVGYQSYGFWHEDVPDNIDELLSSAPESGAPMPVFHLGTNSIDSCPESLELAERAWEAGRTP